MMALTERRVVDYYFMMRCNIDARGKALRLMLGIVVALLGVILLLIWRSGVLPWAWFAAAAAVLVIGGGLMIFEGWAGWCVVRAMGFRTRI